MTSFLPPRGDEKLLRSDVGDFFIDITLDRVDALAERIDAEFFADVGHLPIAPKWADPVLAVGFDVVRKATIVSEPRVEEVGVRRHTFLFFEFRDDLSGSIVFDIVVVVLVVLLFGEAEGERVGGFVVGVEGVDRR
jgi:hypothetical protein